MAIAFFDFDGTLTLRDSTALCVVPSIRMRLLTPARGLQIASIDRMRLDGTIIPRAAFVGEPIHRVEMRVQQRVPLRGRASLMGFAEVFNLFDRANYGAYDLTETSPNFGRPIATPNLSYAARTVQLGFRFQF